ncbi:hypothetical protein NDU88_005616 [Pleurodeles waltl]|uniref:Uncharacterized protein n=1 Tax=Pleurodeles waltl TaxID=8319 RepID=A0AAV7RM41_PLEWA|nr:hypothetical protein NDU88_005616 [Pleurodeles waltl]
MSAMSAASSRTSPRAAAWAKKGMQGSVRPTVSCAAYGPPRPGTGTVLYEASRRPPAYPSVPLRRALEGETGCSGDVLVFSW